MASSCLGIKKSLVACIKHSDCMAKQKLGFHECLRQHREAMDPDCYRLRIAYFECKRGQLDMTTRFRGNPGYHFDDEKKTEDSKSSK